jgi:NAD(P)H dehydrogenase (quinone)
MRLPLGCCQRATGVAQSNIKLKETHTMTQVAIIYHTGYGHTEVVANSIAQGVKDGGATPLLLKIESLTADFSSILEQASGADAIMFGAPTYMGDVSAGLKAFFEATAGIWFNAGWKDKIAGGFTNSFNAAGDKAQSLSSMVVFAMQHGMIWAGPGVPAASAGKSTPDMSPSQVNRFSYSVGVATQSDNLGPDVTPGDGDKEFARLYGVRIATLAAKLKG